MTPEFHLHTASRYGIVTLAYLGFVAIALPETGLGVAWPSMQRTFGIPLDALGALLILSRIGLVLASFNSGGLAARWGQGNVLVAGSALRSVALFGYAIAPTWPALLTVSVLSGLGGGVLAPGFNSYFAINHGPRLMNWLHASFGLGALLGPAMMTAIISSGHAWQWGYVVAAVVQLGLTAGFVLTRHDWGDVEQPAPEISNEITAAACSSATVNRMYRILLWLSMALFFVSAGLEATTGQWSFTLFSESRGAPVAAAGFWVSAYWLSFTLTRVLFGFVADRFAPGLVMRAGILIAGVAATLLALDLHDGISYLSLVAMGMALAPMAPLLTSTTAARLGQANAVRGVGFQVGAAGIGIALLPALAGVLAGRISVEMLGPFLVALCMLLWILFETTNTLVRRRAAT